MENDIQRFDIVIPVAEKNVTFLRIRGRHINDRIIDRLSMDLHIASFEVGDAPFPYNLGWLMFCAKRKIRCMLSLDRVGGRLSENPKLVDR